jgi:hypothetical protein
MSYKSITDFIKPTIITAQQYGTKVSVEIDHSDTDLDELMDAFQTLVIGLGYHESAWKSWVIDRADEYRETDAEELKEKLTEWQDDEIYDAVFHRDIKLTDKEIDEAIAQHNAHEDGFDIDSNDGGFDGNPTKEDTGTVFFTVPVNFYTDEEDNRVYDYEGMADEFEEKLSALDRSAVVMVSVEVQPVNKALKLAAKRFNKTKKK